MHPKLYPRYEKVDSAYAQMGVSVRAPVEETCYRQVWLDEWSRVKRFHREIPRTVGVGDVLIDAGWNGHYDSLYSQIYDRRISLDNPLLKTLYERGSLFWLVLWKCFRALPQWYWS